MLNIPGEPGLKAPLHCVGVRDILVVVVLGGSVGGQGRAEEGGGEPVVEGGCLQQNHRVTTGTYSLRHQEQVRLVQFGG